MRTKKRERKGKKERKPNKKGTRVRFENPPVTSFHVRPKTQPDEIEKLYFTERELDMLYDDLCQTDSIDDIEVVAFSSLSLAKEEIKKRREQSESDYSDEETSESSSDSSATSDLELDYSKSEENKENIKILDNIMTKDGSVNSFAEPTLQENVLLESVSWKDIVHNCSTELNQYASLASSRSHKLKDSLSRQRRPRKRNSFAQPIPAEHKSYGTTNLFAQPLPAEHKSDRTTAGHRKKKEKEVQIFFRQRSIPKVIPE